MDLPSPILSQSEGEAGLPELSLPVFPEAEPAAADTADQTADSPAKPEPASTDPRDARPSSEPTKVQEKESQDKTAEVPRTRDSNDIPTRCNPMETEAAPVDEPTPAGGQVKQGDAGGSSQDQPGAAAAEVEKSQEPDGAVAEVMAGQEEAKEEEEGEPSAKKTKEMTEEGEVTSTKKVTCEE